MKLDKEDQKPLLLWAADCAEHVLPCSETQYPNDNRPRKAIEATRAWVLLGTRREAREFLGESEGAYDSLVSPRLTLAQVPTLPVTVVMRPPTQSKLSPMPPALPTRGCLPPRNGSGSTDIFQNTFGP